MKSVKLAACAVALTVGGLTPLGLSPAGATPASQAVARGFGAEAKLAGTPVLDRSAAGLAEVTLPPGGDVANRLLLVPVAPVVVSGTAEGTANAHVASDIPTALTQAPGQLIPGPYNVRGVGLVEGLEVGLPVTGGVGLPLLEASAVRGEAVGVCRAGVASYSINSEILELNVGGTDVGLNDPVTQIIDLLDDVLDPLTQVLDIKRNEPLSFSDGVGVNALHVTVLGALNAVPIVGQEPLLDVVVGHAEARGLQCAPVPQCSDTQDNDGDGVIDAQDPGCITNGVFDPNDNDERNECIDGIDNADPEDNLVDFGRDPGCDSAQDDDETDLPRTAELPRTGGDASTTVPMAGGFALIALGALTLRRRSQAAR